MQLSEASIRGMGTLRLGSLHLMNKGLKIFKCFPGYFNDISLIRSFSRSPLAVCFALLCSVSRSVESRLAATDCSSMKAIMKALELVTLGFKFGERRSHLQGQVTSGGLMARAASKTSDDALLLEHIGDLLHCVCEGLINLIQWGFGQSGGGGAAAAVVTSDMNRKYFDAETASCEALRGTLKHTSHLPSSMARRRCVDILIRLMCALSNAGYSGAETVAMGCSVAELKNMGYSAAQLKAAGYSAAQLTSAGYSIAEQQVAEYAESFSGILYGGKGFRDPAQVLL